MGPSRLGSKILDKCVETSIQGSCCESIKMFIELTYGDESVGV